ncbi:hypothetical protein H696_04824 [Fonticula alba]|uniref:Xaa-Pro aminopeptidase n=1 Tax=Fonticula alba TaxID=691883 RepID=A0A058Z4V9_FONAL|nr:hypothetical protein H696_04824 [Fonticula alba]KCV68532.1 hypothetical protein H696_04824 [Fonticula alba]|eukprot:XP_009496964.1 hypothetical protein H696_04824 [Fonticula alba]
MALCRLRVVALSPARLLVSRPAASSSVRPQIRSLSTLATPRLLSQLQQQQQQQRQHLPASWPPICPGFPTASQVRHFASLPTMSSSKASTTQKLGALRELMRGLSVHAVVIPSEDAHQSEYLAPVDERRAYISGFTGSAGFAVVTLDAAALWTDARYFLQAEAELDDNWTLMKQGMPGVLSRAEWLAERLSPNSVVGVDPAHITASAARTLAAELAAKGHRLVSLEQNLVDQVRQAAGEAPPGGFTAPLRVLPDSLAGRAVADKLADLRAKIQAKNCRAIVITALDEVAWLFNLRGDDVPYNPVFFAFALVTASSAVLFTNVSRIDAEIHAHLAAAGATVAPYDAFAGHLRDLRTELEADVAAALRRLEEEAPGPEHVDEFAPAGQTPEQARSQQARGQVAKVWLGQNASWQVARILSPELCHIHTTPVCAAKAVKNAAELQAVAEAHLVDAVALCRFFAWLEEAFRTAATAGGGAGHACTLPTETEAAAQLETFRRMHPTYRGPSFSTISGTGPNGAVVHYSARPGADRRLSLAEVFLCDSGGQYDEGTTDVTRTFFFGGLAGTPPPALAREAYTRVLRGALALERLVFPATGVSGFQVDALARSPLWQAGLDYRHGTGHGVGAGLCVHEGPHGIGPRQAYGDTPLAEGMLVTNEPGYYHDGSFGIRIENVLRIHRATPANNFGNTGFLAFEPLTLVPVQRDLLILEQLSPEERSHLNAYHLRCREEVGARFADRSCPGYRWLMEQTVPI